MLGQVLMSMLDRFHRLFVVILGASTGGTICYLKGGLCRPTPLYHYILNEFVEEDDIGSYIQSTMLVLFVSVIITCQVAIEVKRFRIRRAERRVDDLAASAMKQVEEAVRKLKRKPGPVQLSVQLLQQRSEESGEAAENLSHQVTLVGSEPRQSNDSGVADSRSSKEQAVKIARFVSIFGILPALVTIFNISFADMPGYRPHGSSASFLVIYGVFIPLSIILHNAKLKTFAKSFIRENTIGLLS